MEKGQGKEKKKYGDISSGDNSDTHSRTMTRDQFIRHETTWERKEENKMEKEMEKENDKEMDMQMEKEKGMRRSDCIGYWAGKKGEECEEE